MLIRIQEQLDELHATRAEAPSSRSLIVPPAPSLQIAQHDPPVNVVNQGPVNSPPPEPNPVFTPRSVSEHLVNYQPLHDSYYGLPSLISRNVAAKMLPSEFSGGTHDNPIKFLRDLENLLSVQALPVIQTKALLTSSLTATAARWWRTHRDSLHDNEAIMASFSSEFISPQYSQAIWSQIHAAKQSDGESCNSFIDRLCALYDSLPSHIDEKEIISKVLTAAHPQVALHLGNKPHHSIGHLKAEAFRIDGQLQALYRSGDNSNRRRQASHPPTMKETQGQYNRSSRSTHNKLSCYICSDPSHFAKNCPLKVKNGAGPNRGFSPRDAGGPNY